MVNAFLVIKVFEAPVTQMAKSESIVELFVRLRSILDYALSFARKIKDLPTDDMSYYITNFCQLFQDYVSLE